MTDPTNPRRPGAPSDADLADGRRLVADLDHTQWKLGDLAIKVAGAPTVRGRHDPNRKALDDFAEGIGIAPTRLAEYRTVAAAWSPDERIEGLGWALHRGLVGRPDRSTHLQAFAEECRTNGVTPTRDRLRSWPPHRAGPDDKPGTIYIPATIDEAVARLREIGEYFARARRRLEDVLIPSMVDEGVDFTDRASVEAYVDRLDAEPHRSWELDFDEPWVEDEIDAYVAMHTAWSRRHHPVEADPWEDR